MQSMRKSVNLVEYQLILSHSKHRKAIVLRAYLDVVIMNFL